MKFPRPSRSQVAAFLLGFTVWLPFLFLAYDLCPFKLVLEGDMWGWEFAEWRSPTEYPMGSYQGFFSLIAFYVCYGALVVLIVMLFHESKKDE